MGDAPNINSVLRRLGYAFPNVKLLATGCIDIVLQMQVMRVDDASVEIGGLTLRMNG